MKTRYPRFHKPLFCLILLILTPVAGAAGFNSYPTVGPGLKYIHERCGDEPLSIHILRIDRSRSDFKFITTLAQNTIFGLSPLSKQIQSIPRDLGQPVAAVNGDFFEIKPGPYQGDPCGLQIYQGEMVSGPSDEAVFWIDSAGRPRIDAVKSNLQITWPNGTKTPFTLNEQRKDNQAVLYSPTLGSSTRTTGGTEIILEPVDKTHWLPLRPNQTFPAKIQTLRKEGNTALAPARLILSIGPALASKIPALKPGDVLTISTQLTPSLDQVTTALGGHPILLRQGKRQPLPTDGLYTLRHPRTAIGWNKEFIFWCVVDGRQTGLSRGMTLPELTDFLIRLGCTEALNLDGGGSSTFWLGGQILNAPSDGQERPVANTLILLRKPAPKPN